HARVLATPRLTVPVPGHPRERFVAVTEPGIIRPMARRTSSERLIGRAVELATVDALLNRLGAPGPGAGASRSSRGGPGCLLIGGEAGIGKTRLVTELAQTARSRGYGVAVGGCVEHGAEILPLHAVD